ncbi:hypothetical protein ACLOJK_007806 [Asimina triloba]
MNLVKMGRVKLAMKLIEDPKARKLTFNKRKKGLMKKALEFSILCDVNTCFICYKKDSDQLITWPESLEAVKPIVRRYLMTSKEERVKREIGLSLLDGKKVARGKQKSTNQPMFPTWDDRLNSWSVPALHKLASILDEKIEMVSKRIQLLRSSNPCLVQSSRRCAVSKSNFPLPPFPLSFVKPEEQLYSANDFLHTQAASGTSVMPMPNPLPHFRKFSDTNNFSSMSTTHALLNQESSMSKLPPFIPESSIPTLPLFGKFSETNNFSSMSTTHALLNQERSMSKLPSFIPERSMPTLPLIGKFSDTNNFSSMSTTHALLNQETSMSKLPPFIPESSMPTLPLFGKFSDTNNFSSMSTTHALLNQETSMSKLPPFIPESSMPTLPLFGKFSDTNNFSSMSTTHALLNQETSMSKLPPFIPESSIPTLPLFDQESKTSTLPLVNQEVGVMASMNSMMLSQSSECGGHGGSALFPQQPWFQDNQYSGQSHFLPMNPQPLQTILLHPQAHHLDQGWP